MGFLKDKVILTFSHWLFLQNTRSYMFDRALSMSLDHLSCFAVVLSGIHGRLIYAKLIIVFTPN